MDLINFDGLDEAGSVISTLDYDHVVSFEKIADSLVNSPRGHTDSEKEHSTMHSSGLGDLNS